MDKSEGLVLGSERFRTQGETNIFYEATYKGEPCFAVVHTGTNHIELFDNDEKFLCDIIQKIKRTSALIADKKKNGYILKFRKERKHSVSLRTYLFAKYKGIPVDAARKLKICLDESAEDRNRFLDLRSCNLYAAGTSRPHTSTHDIDIMQNMTSGYPVFMKITVYDTSDKSITEIAPYTPELYEMLTSSKFCTLVHNTTIGRIIVVVHYAHNKNGYMRVNLVRFLCVYKEHFNSYEKMKGSVKRFIHDYAKLDSKHAGEDGSHLNASKWDDSFQNIMFMNSVTNIGMRDYIKLFSGLYDCIPAVNDRGEILLAFRYRDCFVRYFKCPTPEDYLQWQKLFLGKDSLTAKLQVLTRRQGDGVHSDYTPCGKLLVGEASKRDDTYDFWTYQKQREELLALPDKAFIVFDRNTVKIADVIKLICSFFGAKAGECYCSVIPVAQ